MSVWDELRFGPDRTLNLREHLPSAPHAVRRAEAWLREQQVRDVHEVLVITGRGSHSIDGIAVIRRAISKLLGALRRQGVVAGFQEHNAGAFAVQLAPIRSLLEAPIAAPRTMPRAPGFEGLSPEVNALLRQLAERSLDALGVLPTHARIEDEMHRHLRILVPALAVPGDMDVALRKAILAALEDYD
jgi:hypothetical protein